MGCSPKVWTKEEWTKSEGPEWNSESAELEEVGDGVWLSGVKEEELRS
jgi:hypothetical protein